MIKQHKVSIIIPVKEINDYICESIPEILKLKYRKFEIIIVTDDLPEKPEINLTGEWISSRTSPPDRSALGGSSESKNNYYSSERSESRTMLTNNKWPISIIASGPVSPAIKRDLGAKIAQGEILAFLDDDAYPRSDWLNKVLPHFKNPKIAGIGGPAITPEDDSFGQKLSGAVFESFLGGGGARNRYLPIGKAREVDDWPTVNLLIRKAVFQQIGGFDNEFWPGEDTKLCLDIIQAGYKIIYEPRAMVWHHRRAGLARHLNQIGQYARHRGHFAKRYPATSLRLAYFMPSIFVVLVFGGLILVILISNFQFLISNEIPISKYPNQNPGYWLPARNALLAWRAWLVTGYWLYVLCSSFYVLGLLTNSLRAARHHRARLMIILLPIYIFLTHIWYGIRFIQGLGTKKFKSELRK